MPTPDPTVPPDRPAAPDAVPESGGTVVQSPAEAARAMAGSGTHPPEPRPAVAVPGFEVVRELGRGAMGVVYEARQTALNRTVALKMVLGGALADPVARARFQIEAEAVAALHHPHVVQVYEFGGHDELPYFAMEFVGGGTLTDQLRRAGRLAPRDAAAVVARVADGVAAAHAAGIVHRDLKPGNVLLAADGTPKVADFGLAKLASSDVTETRVLMGTPAYMPPELASGRARFAAPAADVWALGVILYECLTGLRPFRAPDTDVLLSMIRVADPVSPRKHVPAVPRDLETVCLRCLEKEPGRRYAGAAALAADLRAFLDGRPVAARPVGPAERAWKWARRNPGWSIAAAAVVLVALVGGAVAQSFRTAAAEETRRVERETRANSLAEALATTDTAKVPERLDELAGFRDLSGPRLRDLAGQPVRTKPGLHARMALLPEEPRRADELAAYLPECRPGELLALREVLRPHAATTAPPLWEVLAAPAAPGGARVRAACALAALTQNDPRWPFVAPWVVAGVVAATPDEFVVWAEALRPVRLALLPSLMARYAESRRRIDAGRLDASGLAAEASAFDLAADLLARYAADRPAELAELAMTAAARHVRLFEPAVAANGSAVVPLLVAELEKRPVPDGVADAVTGVPLALVVSDPLADRLARRQGYAAAALARLGHPRWQHLAHSADPSLRSYLTERLAAVGVPAADVIRRFAAEPDLSVRRALVIALGDFEVTPDWEPQRAEFAGHLLRLYRDDPDPGLHSAIDWLLRQKWGMAARVTAIDDELAAAARTRRAPPDDGKDWFVNGEGRTFAVVRPPRWDGTFQMGSPLSEPERNPTSEHRHPRHIGRAFAIATREVTRAAFERFWRERFRGEPPRNPRYSPHRDGPALAVTWYHAALYCNWLSEREGIPEHEWCYEWDLDPNFRNGVTIKAGHLSLNGYRLPTEAEWECASRAGSDVGRHYGRSDELLRRYGWFNGSTEAAQPVGLLRPNDLGLFDTLGNALEWVKDPLEPYANRAVDHSDRPERVVATDFRVGRGGSFFNLPAILRSGCRMREGPSRATDTYGFRPARTIADLPRSSP